ncbi:MAG: FAD-binding oxidoreductase [Alphaproteobacteria bacterium]|nr:FAD-binding oxidoreductase [Alphaproteobacteria bacterium]
MSLSYPPSYYAATAIPFADQSILEGQHQVDVCIIGGGYTGLHTALELRKHNLSVILLEEVKVGWGASGRNGGQLHSGFRMGPADLIKNFGIQTAKDLWLMAEESKTIIHERIAQYNIPCDYKNGLLVTASRPADMTWMQQDVEALKTIFNYSKCAILSKEQVNDEVASTLYYGGIVDQGGGHLHPLNLALGLAQAAAAEGVKIYEKSKVLNIQGNGPVTVVTAQGTVKANKAVICCDGYLRRLEKRIASKIMPIANYILATEPLGEKMAREIIAHDWAICDSKYVVNYYRFSSDHRLLYGGGETYSSREPKDMKTFVKKHMVKTFPQLSDVKIDYAWGGWLGISMSRLPDIGCFTPGLYYAQGYSGQGVALSSLVGRVIAESITGFNDRFDLLSRFPNRSFPGGTLLRWPGQVAAMLWYSMLDRFR